MNYSSHHKRFAEYIRFKYQISKQDVLEHLEDYLGTNYKEVLNYWFYDASLGIEQWAVYWDRHHKLGEEAHIKASDLAENLSSEVIDPRFVPYLAYEVLEIIAAHLYIERGIPFTFLPLIFDL
jgi:hypothetical protein